MNSTSRQNPAKRLWILWSALVTKCQFNWYDVLTYFRALSAKSILTTSGGRSSITSRRRVPSRGVKLSQDVHLLPKKGRATLLIDQSLFFFFGHATHMACGILVPQPGIKPGPTAGEAQSLNHYTTREVPTIALMVKPNGLKTTKKITPWNVANREWGKLSIQLTSLGTRTRQAELRSFPSSPSF